LVQNKDASNLTNDTAHYKSILSIIDEEHKRALEYETLLDLAVLGYASKLEEGAGMVPDIQGTELSLVLSSQSSGPSLPMGWALKHSHARSTRFSTKQKEYLIAKFQICEQTRQKADPASVSRVMRTAKRQ